MIAKHQGNHGGNKMRKFLFTSLLLAAWSSFGAFQYEVNNMGPNLKMTSDTALSVDFIKGGGLVQSFGYYTFNSGDIPYYVMGMKLNEVNFGTGDLATGYLGDFKAGEQIGLWVKTTTGETLVSNFFWNRNLVQQSQYVPGTDHNIGFGDNFFDVHWTQPDYLNNITIGVGERAPAPPTGQPLPGVWATLLIGGGVCAATTRLRRKNRV